MKKLIAMLAAVLMAAPSVFGQETVTGTVVDKKGNPLPGVKVEIPGYTDFTISDLDGKFSITPQSSRDNKVQFSYAGMNSPKKKLKDGMKVKMKESNWWSRQPDEWNWFANAIVAIPTTEKPVTPAYGFMLGRVKYWGYYIKGVTNTLGDDCQGTYGYYGDFYRFPGLPKDNKNRYWSVTGGMVFRLWSPIHIYFGMGYADFRCCQQNQNGDWYENSDNSIKGVASEVGLMLRLNRVTVTLGGTVGTSDTDATDVSSAYAGNFGIGYSF